MTNTQPDTVQANEFLQRGEKGLVIDVRSPGEYATGHVPNAVNIPLFDDEERKKVGICYKQEGRQPAILLGLQLIGHKMAGFIRQVQKYNPTEPVGVYCWRGGMRSASFAWLLSTYGVEIYLLNKGYKAYRAHMLSAFTKASELIILSGQTGSGKTDILKALREQGEQVLDLEGVACHKGSVFGAIGEQAQPTTEQFQNNLHHQISTFNLNKRIWLEDENIVIGQVVLPEPLWQNMAKSPRVRVSLSKSHRIKRLVNEYTGHETGLLQEAAGKLEKRLGNKDLNVVLKAIEQNNFGEAADILLGYYDKAYDNSYLHKKHLSLGEVILEDDQPSITATRIIKLVEERTYV
ncbi:MAG: tRNA 2-selenouridine(34) synthase MnmH [Cyclobacteriaceae bacterium]|nr:tRNA 2-selenouridine(34) synthase MnmH [Cyclobacteriaceae bacterium]